MKKSKVPGIIVIFALVILLPTLMGEYFLYQTILEQNAKTNTVCLKPVLVEKAVEVTPTVVPSPTGVIRFVPKTATGGAR